MKEGGRIITIGSINGERITGSGGADYAATKAALVGYTHGWARDLGPRKITVNLVQPGPIDTDMNPDNTEFAEMIKDTAKRLAIAAPMPREPPVMSAILF